MIKEERNGASTPQLHVKFFCRQKFLLSNSENARTRNSHENVSFAKSIFKEIVVIISWFAIYCFDSIFASLLFLSIEE
jgi:hypothetical protein